MGIFLRDGNYWIDYKYNGQRKRERIGPDKKLAEAALESRKLDILLQKRLNPNKIHDSPLFEDFVKEYLQYAKGKKKTWKRDLIITNSAEPHFRGMKIDDIPPTVIAEYKAKRADEVKPATVNRELACLRHIFSMAEKWGRASYNPVKEVKVLRAPIRPERILNDSEIERLISSAKGRTCDIIIVAINTGMKLGEILSLKWEDVDVSGGILVVKGSKKERDRKIPINSTVSALLSNLKRADNPYVFGDPKTVHPTKKVEKSFKGALRRAGLEGCTFHDLRHSFARKLAQNGVDPMTVKELLGHSTLEVTKRYFQSTPEKKKEAVELLSSTHRWKASTKLHTGAEEKTLTSKELQNN